MIISVHIHICVVMISLGHVPPLALKSDFVTYLQNNNRERGRKENHLHIRLANFAANCVDKWPPLADCISSESESESESELHTQ